LPKINSSISIQTFDVKKVADMDVFLL